MEKIIRFFSEAGALGIGSVLFAVVLWFIALYEHSHSENISALWFQLGGCAAFCLGSFLAWSKADDRANDRKPRLAFSVDLNGFYITHLEGGAARFIEVSPLVKQNGTRVEFDQLDFLAINDQRTLIPHLRIADLDRGSHVRGMLIMMFQTGLESYPLSIKFFWNGEWWKEESIWLSQGEGRRFFTRPRENAEETDGLSVN